MLVNADKKWDYALGMIKIDGLEPSSEFKELIKKEKMGEMTTDDIRKVLDKKIKLNRRKQNERSLCLSRNRYIKKSC